jgi:predicted MFS family arabinose efflux permease
VTNHMDQILPGQLGMTDVPLPARRSDRLRVMSVYAVIVLASVQAGGAAPTPLYHLYQQDWDLSPLTLTVAFAVYPIGMLASLLTVGSLSDHLGRRPVILAALILSVIAMIVFIFAQSAETLIAARLLQGLATGTATSALGAVMLDTNRGSGALINSVTAFMGTTIGAVGASALVVYAPEPLKLVYALLLACFAVQLGLLRWMPDTVAKKPGALASLKPHVAVPTAARRTFVRVSPVNIAGWALGAFYLSLVPSLVRTVTGLTSPLVGGVVVASLTLTGAAAILASRNRAARRTLIIGASFLIAGVLITLGGVNRQSVSLLLLGTIVAGAGFGTSFFGAARSVLPIAAPDERAGLLSAFYIESYLAFSLPSILVGLAVPSVGLVLSTYAYGGTVILLAVVSLVATIAQRSAS